MSPRVITRFAPSPTGFLHIGNARTALINYLYAKKHQGKFLLRLDNTDVARCRDEYVKAIHQDLKWLNLQWDDSFDQLSRKEKYQITQNQLVDMGRLYPCYESAEELEIKRKLQLSRGLPPIYDRSSLMMTDSKKREYDAEGRRPHYRFLINQSDIVWDDMIKGKLSYKGAHLSDPIVIRADGTMTYMLCSIIDDIDYMITDIIRGEDHVTNTAIQIQMFEALNSRPPRFGHLSMVTAKDEKISKRIGGFDIANLRDVQHYHPMAINSFLALTGSKHKVTPHKDIEELLELFDITAFSKTPTTFNPDELLHINHKIIVKLTYPEVRAELEQLGLSHITESFWLAVRDNIQKVVDIGDWWQVCHEPKLLSVAEDPEYLRAAVRFLPESFSGDIWNQWTTRLRQETGRTGKSLFMPLRIALTGRNDGPEMKHLLPLLGRNEIITRLNNHCATR